MKKVGLITFHSSINYGVYLQAYALQSFVEKIGCEVEIIDYTRFTEGEKKKKSIAYRLKHFKETLKVLRMLIFLHDKRVVEKEKKFNKFALANFRLSKPMNSINDIENEQANYDKFICGSDQIWNPEYTQANPVYFLEFAPSEKRISYAPSFGIGRSSEVFNDYLKQYREYLCAFSSISVRERTGQLIVQDIAAIKPCVVVDPTLLLSKDFWSRNTQPVNTSDREYVLFYVLSDNYQYRKLAKRIAEDGKYEVICIPTGPLWDGLRCVRKCYAGVDEFLYLMKNAKYIITDSFHGTAFSVIFQKDFFAILRNDTNHSLCSRIEDFLEHIQLKENCVDESNILNIDIYGKTDYSNSLISLQTWIIESKEFLEKALRIGDVSE